MRTYYKILLPILPLLLLFACDRHDSMDDDVLVGNMAPQVYWEIGSSTVTAGNSVPFAVQYYTTSKTPISHIEVWYSIQEEEIKSVTCPWTISFSYSLSSTVSSEKRTMQKISSYPHNATYRNDSLKAYYFESSFPTSVTLSSISWIKPSSFATSDSAKLKKYFGENYMQHFKDSLFKLMSVKDFQNMYQGLNLVEDFRTYLDSVKNDNTGGYDYVFPKDAHGNRPIPQEIVDIYENIPFSDIIYNKSNNSYDVDFTRQYILKPILKVLDSNNIAGSTSINPDIYLN